MSWGPRIQNLGDIGAVSESGRNARAMKCSSSRKKINVLSGIVYEVLDDLFREYVGSVTQRLTETDGLISLIYCSPSTLHKISTEYLQEEGIGIASNSCHEQSDAPVVYLSRHPRLFLAGQLAQPYGRALTGAKGNLLYLGSIYL